MSVILLTSTEIIFQSRVIAGSGPEWSGFVVPRSQKRDRGHPDFLESVAEIGATRQSHFTTGELQARSSFGDHVYSDPHPQRDRLSCTAHNQDPPKRSLRVGRFTAGCQETIERLG